MKSSVSTKKKRFITQVVAFLLVLMMSLSAVVPAFADVTSDITSIYDGLSDDAKGKVEVGEDSVKVNGNSIQAYKDKASADAAGAVTTALTIGGTTVFVTESNLNMIKSAMQGLSDEVTEAENDVSVDGAKNKVNNLSKQFNVAADIEGGGRALSSFKQTIGTLLGILTYFIIIMLTVFTSIDIAYITIPPLRSALDNYGMSGGNMSKSTGDGGAKFRFITDEAYYAVQQSTNNNGNGKSAISTYISKRILAIVLVGIAVYLLLTGNISLIMNLALTLVGGIIDQIAVLAGM